MNKKILYKLELSFVKYSPMLVGLIILMNNILAYFNIYIHTHVGSILGVSLLTVFHMYVSSRLYKFCEYHRMFIHYILVNILLYCFDYYVGIPLSDKGYFCMNLGIAGIFLFLILYYHQKCEDYVDENNQETTESDY